MHTSPSRRTLSLVGALTLAATLTPGAAAAELESSTFGGVEPRAIGPAVMSGRIAALTAVPTDPLTIYVGSASGGLWRSKDGGITFAPVFDGHTQSIGAVTVDPGDPETVWVGTGETWARNSVSVGDGVYKSTDGGDTWRHMGLADSERIAEVAVDPRDGDTVYVCATGHLWDDHEQRGVYKSTDGGQTWEASLQVDAATGCSSLAMDPQDPRILYAGMWQFRRQPWTFTSGGPGSGLYRSTDGGASWQEMRDGLPKGDLGRIAVAVAPSRPSTVYAVVEAAEKTALYRSDDLGLHWRETSSGFNVSIRPFYFALVVVDPQDHEIVYKPGLTLSISRDGGRSFSSPFASFSIGSIHPDHHALWIDPRNPLHLILGTDGGVYESQDRGGHWRHFTNLPVSQFYRVAVDSQWPYNVYGGLQDNGSWMGPSRAPGGIRNKHWDNVGFGDGFWTFADPEDPDLVYSEYQGGNLARVRLSTGELKDITPYPPADGARLRFNWNTPFLAAPSGALYVGSQYLHRSTDRGESWQRLSPDLTTDDPAKQKQMESGGLTVDNSTAENHTTLYAIAESPKDPRVIWVGTDDGNLQVTRDGGGSWSNVVGNVPGVPAHTWVSFVEASPHDAATAFVTFDGHRTGDITPYLFRTTDHGASWQPLVGGESAVEGYAFSVRQDLERPDLLFLGTELGLWVSIDGGGRWARFAGRLPRVAVHDMVIHPEADDLVLATHGRGIWILDDLTPLRALTPEAMQQELAILPSEPAIMTLGGGLQDFGSDAEFVAPNPPQAASIHYHLAKRHLFGDFRVEVFDGAGELITTLPAGLRVGINQVQWPMRLKAPKVPPGNSLVPAFEGPRVPEGTYNYRITKGDQTYEGQVSLVADPRSPHAAEDRKLQQETALELYRQLGRLTYVADTLEDLRDQARARADTLGARDATARRLTAWADELEALRKRTVATHPAGWLSGEEQLRERLSSLYGSVNGFAGRPTDSQLERLAVLSAELAAREEELEQKTAAATLAELGRRLQAKQLAPLVKLSREEWERKREGGPAGSDAMLPFFGWR
ncbi:MAG TPA: glycosyl hydrolase [Thermoanaerobaculia bacterium]|nr:glycosyl hydrolase [Thermoanaerobaculia bacterium]